MSLKFVPRSILGFGVAIALLAYFGGFTLEIPELTAAAKPFVLLFLGIWLIFIFLTVVRNITSM